MNPCTREQIINRAKVNMIHISRYCSELKEYDDKFHDTTNENWSTFKNFWLTAYKKVGITKETTTTGVHHEAYNTMGTNDTTTTTAKTNISEEDSTGSLCPMITKMAINQATVKDLKIVAQVQQQMLHCLFNTKWCIFQDDNHQQYQQQSPCLLTLTTAICTLLQHTIAPPMPSIPNTVHLQLIPMQTPSPYY